MKKHGEIEEHTQSIEFRTKSQIETIKKACCESIQEQEQEDELPIDEYIFEDDTMKNGKVKIHTST